jgi:antirestriction protein ArdC
MIAIQKYGDRKMERKLEAARIDIYEKITDRIIADLKRDVRPWVQPWHAGGRITRPLRHNGQPYSGINVLLLWAESVAKGLSSATWMTFKQAIELGGCVRKSETGSTIVYANTFTKTETADTGQEIDRTIPFLKAYSVFCVDQIDGLPERFYLKQHDAIDPAQRIAHADAFFAQTGAIIRHGGSQAFYMPSTDVIQMPPFEAFKSAETYTATLAHECVHWTSAPHRLNRDLSRYSKDKSERAREELIAELGAVFLCADLGVAPELEPRPDHASYIASWLKVLGQDKRFIFSAAAQAQKAAAFLHGLQPSTRADALAA